MVSTFIFNPVQDNRFILLHFKTRDLCMMSSGSDKCPEWLREFQTAYLKNGKKDTDAQKDYLWRLAQHYEKQYGKTKNWVDAFKVSYYRYALVD